MELQGFAIIKIDATTIVSTHPNKDFTGCFVRVLEFANDGGVLLINDNSTAIAMVDKEDVITSFKCKMCGFYVLPPNLNFIEEMEYLTKLATRKGGYNTLVSNLVIMSSLESGEYNDKFLFSKQ